MADDLDPAAVERAAQTLADCASIGWRALAPHEKAAWRAHARAALAAARDGASCGARYCTTDDVLGPHQHRAGRTVLTSAAPTVTTEQVEDAEAALRDLLYDDEVEGRDVLDVARLGLRAALDALGIEVREP